ncbi:hypothetical protein SLNWT_5863 [Streptomyces albus]|uniref:Uncharacterized protein n=1 Tax=Streptomyces albus (strain ATCC 21838 / DSM 41398 / FERM P-419 / JCM 4703 / NBRC 107858) TaxID=1081613 RepID=A0A0B5EWR5_STRA4|nr:hypothetical protein SLNWT_5863 [Streptomyces albus]AOU80541.1 hypothetical protein SLNHY_5850 [Streptomyces albus]AYN36252.1 hypothetical protein DUI70_5756 [Streptomyces albus]
MRGTRRACALDHAAAGQSSPGGAPGTGRAAPPDPGSRKA